MSYQILVVEDNPDIANLVGMHLRDLNCEVTKVADGLIALAEQKKKRFDLIILDLMLPGMEGTEVCKEIRKQQDYTPILMLTSKSSELDRVLGLEVGADDYLTKPFSIRELIARVKALFRRIEAFGKQTAEVADVITKGDMVIDINKRLVSIGDKVIDLTAKEFDLLLQFAEHPGRVYSRAQLLDKIWGYGHEGYEHTVNSHINRLRSKIETDPAHPTYVLTVWGVGYKFNDQL
jgi:DNA-binding response OmpR family regulator